MFARLLFRSFITLILLGNSMIAAAALPERPRLLSSAEAREVDADALASATRISAAEARHRLAVQSDSRDLTASLRATYAGRLAGIYRDWTPAPRIVVRLKGQNAVRGRIVNLPSGPVEVSIVSGATRTVEELLQARADHAQALRAAFPSMSGTWVDERTGELVIEVAQLSDAKSARDLATVIAHVPARVVHGGADFNAVLSGSGSLDIPISGGTSLCTGGFVVNIGTGEDRVPGLSSAGHCQDAAASYTTLDGFGASMVLAGQAYDESADVQWYTTTTDDYFEATFFSDEVTQRTVGGVAQKASTSVGDAV